MSDLYKFITFGCWGDLNNENLPVYTVLTEVSKYCKNNNNNCKFIIITGDNYYSMKKEKGNKILYVDRLEKAFDELPTNIDIYLLLGNHDLANDIVSIETEQPVDPDNAIILTKKPEDCIILKTEIDIIKRTPNIKFPNKLTMHYMKNKTLFLMIDTTIYDIYNDLSELNEQQLADKIHCYRELDINLTNMKNILDKQLDEILYIINNIKVEIKNVVISGHHPLIETKIKNKKNKETTETTETTETPVRIKPLMKSYELLNTIYNIYRDTVKYYYLCADYHCYQKGVIHINMAPTVVMTIQQYVVGTGGAELDAAVPKNNYEVIDGISYTVEDAMSINGFLVCKSNKDDILSFKFHKVSNPKPKGGKNKSKTRKIHKKKRKSIKKNRNNTCKPNRK